MADIVERLRQDVSDQRLLGGWGCAVDLDNLEEAATEIERLRGGWEMVAGQYDDLLQEASHLRAENERLRAALSEARAVALEDAARVVKERQYLLSIGTPEEGPFTRQDRVCCETREQAAAAIRALISPDGAK